MLRPSARGLGREAGGERRGLAAIHTARRACSDSPGRAAFTVPLSAFLGKKARTFDLEAMFEQTRRTAVERSRKVLGKKYMSILASVF